MTTENFLSRLDRVKQTGPGRWIARCPAHEDKGPSLSVRETDDGKVLIHDFAGCGVNEILGAIGLEMADLFPERTASNAPYFKPERRPFPAVDILRAIAHEACVVSVCAATILEQGILSPVDFARLQVANERLQSALEAGGLNHG